MECHNFEECEFNGQPECHLPDGVPCPHGVKADKPVAESKTDIEKLIRKGKSFSRKRESIEDELIQDLTTALSTLQAKNEKLREKIEDVRLEGYAKGIGEMSAELEQVKRERDAAIDQLHGYCPSCTHYTPNHNEGPCRTCKHEYYHRLNNESLDNWEWRGPQTEN